MEKQINEHAFNGLVSSLYLACWQQLGKVANPITNKVECNLDQAKSSIDILVMLREKTKGNLTTDEDKMINQVIAVLQMNYVEELNKEKKPDAKKQ